MLIMSGITAIVSGMDLAEWSAINRSYDQALESGNYTEARRMKLRLIQDPEDPSLHVNIASDYISLALVSWCLGKDGEARVAISNAIKLIKNGDNLGNGSEARAEILLHNLHKLPRQLSLREINEICVFTMEIPYAQWRKEMNRTNARIDAMTARFDSEIRSLRRQGDVQASMAKFHAKQEYEKSTGKSFNPNYPPRGEIARDKWNACKRIYDIWGN